LRSDVVQHLGATGYCDRAGRNSRKGIEAARGLCEAAREQVPVPIQPEGRYERSSRSRHVGCLIDYA
jgi:hypothetical protein